MCLAVPGKIQAIRLDGNLIMGDVDFSGVVKRVCLAYTPEARIGDYVIVHVGFALSILNEKEAKSTLDLLENGPNEIRR
jgi:hydrogenase expression/formation protein HypC